jgi:hypothetical protein
MATPSPLSRTHARRAAQASELALKKMAPSRDGDGPAALGASRGGVDKGLARMIPLLNRIFFSCRLGRRRPLRRFLLRWLSCPAVVIKHSVSAYEK